MVAQILLKYRILLIVLFACAFYLGLQVDIMDIDASQYASMCQEMLKSGDYLLLKHRNEDYLDKPPLTFWLGTLSFYLFGIDNWSYKLPSLVFALLAVYSTYKLSILYYSKNVALLAAFALLSSQAIFLITNDCRTDTILMGCVAWASWKFASYLKNNNVNTFYWAFIAMGLGMLTKGPIAIVTIVLAFGSDMLLKLDFKNIFRWQWIVGLIIVCIVIFPFCYGLWLQFGMKGIQFYLWDQSFGRVTGSNTAWKNDGGFFYMFHSFAWSFLPFTAIFLIGLFYKIKKLIQSRFKVAPTQEYFTLFGTILVYIAMSKSQYQLPHYIYVILPYAAIIMATGVEYYWIDNIKPAMVKITFIFQVFVYSILWIITGLLSFYAFGYDTYWAIIFGLLVATCYVVLFQNRSHTLAFYIGGIFTMVSVNIILSGFVYPKLLSYQYSKSMAEQIKKLNIKDNEILQNNVVKSFALDFYSQQVIPVYNDNMEDLEKSKPRLEKVKYLITDSTSLNNLKNMNIEAKIISKHYHYPVSRLTLAFLNPKTRKEKLKEIFLVKIN